MKRITNANEKFVGSEPTFDGKVALSQSELSTALSWYNSEKDVGDAKAYLLAHFKKNGQTAAADHAKTLPEAAFRPAGFIARMLDRGAALTAANKESYDTMIDSLLAKKSAAKIEEIDFPAKPNVQDRMRAQANAVIAALELIIDTRTYGKVPLDILNAVHGPHQAKWIHDWIDSQIAEFNEVLVTKDAQIKEGYSNYTVKDLKALLQFCESIRVTLENKKALAKQSRKPRAKKQKSAEQVTGGVKYLKQDASLKVVSVNPVEIVGASQLWVFNVKYRKLGVLIASDPQGLTVKGTTVYNFDEVKSIQKTLRKPESQIPEILKAGKVALRTAMNDIKAKAAPITGRLSNEVLILKVVK